MPKMKNYWVTISVPSYSGERAAEVAKRLADSVGGRVIGVDREPPQGALVVGDMYEDGL